MDAALSPALLMNEPKASTQMTAKKLKILLAIAYGNLFLGSCYSLMAPIYPAEAEKKEASATAYGLVFGVYQLVMFVSAPIYGKLIIVLKPGFLMKTGMLVSGICVILFSFLEYAPPGLPFIALSIVIRGVDALGASAFLTASYTTLGCELPDVIGRAMSIVETTFSVGLAVGPVIGGILYEAGGFSLPFLVVGALLLTGTVVNMFLFTDTDDVPPKSISVRQLLANIDFLIDLLAISVCFAMLGFNEATLEPHIRQFQLTPTTIGAIFLISGVLDAVSAPVWGIVAEKVPNAQILIFIGGICFIVCFLVVGPVPFFTFPTSVTMVLVSQVLLGLGMAGQIVSSLTHGMKLTVERGFPDDVGTYGLISGLLFSAACFGAFFGPTIGGILIDHIGYRYATFAITIVETIVTAICGLRLLFRLFRKKPHSVDVEEPTEKSIEELSQKSIDPPHSGNIDEKNGKSIDQLNRRNIDEENAELSNEKSNDQLNKKDVDPSVKKNIGQPNRKMKSEPNGK
ncbi:MFS-type transporter SLC18B1 [Trichonephila inaurata madagascariensis]|uniref:MFS-type transporter SLC18B1 n=1 Tax=Trichonephila inaurata madagascariensis TaxID=2747483 RepID=A0A8X7BTA2_9ARAC|nr:MFS-type transporter SLC18B1 [Trichonephila inaurata madagascariensis]